jgi:hypothetical protein
MASGGRNVILRNKRSEGRIGAEKMENADNKILEECVTALKMEIRAASEMGGLLEEDGIGTKNLTGIYGDLLRLP